MLHDPKKLLLVAGPSLLENKLAVFKVAEALKALSQKHAESLTVVFRSSFDKPHRGTLFSARGSGLEEGLRLLTEVKDQLELKISTDVHERQQIEPASLVCDVLQIPSLLCRQNDLITDAAKSGCVVNLRKGVALSPIDALQLAEKVECAHATEFWMTERGSAFGYNQLMCDMRIFTALKHTDCPVLFDASITTELPEGVAQRLKNSARAFSLPLAKAALAAGAAGLYLDVHPEPENALVDNATQLPLKELDGFVAQALELWQKLHA